MEFLFLTILNMSLTGAFVIAAIYLARLLLKKVPKIISYCLWAVAGFRLVFPFAIESAWSLIPFRTQPIPTLQAVPGSGIPEMGSSSQQSISSITGGGMSPSLPAPPEIGAIAVPEEIAAPLVGADPLQALISIGAAVWLIGFALMLLYGLGSYLLLRHRMRNSVSLYENIYEAAQIQSPFVLGFFAPKIYLPLGLSLQERKYIILHEQTHIRRRDHILKFAAYFALCLHWFNPLVWIAFFLMSTDMEMSCDESVLRHLGSETKADYSRILVMLATDRRTLAGAPLAFGEGAIKGRVKNILKFKRTHKIISVIAAILVLTFGIGLALTQTDESPEEASPASAFMPTGHGEFVPSAFTIRERSAGFEVAENALSAEEAANLAAQYLWEMFGASIDGTEIRMHYGTSSEQMMGTESNICGAHPERSQTVWLGEVFADHYDPEYQWLYGFRIDAFSGAPIELRQAFQFSRDSSMRELAAEEMERGQEVAIAYADLAFHHRGTHAASATIAERRTMPIALGDGNMQYSASFLIADDGDRLAHVTIALETKSLISIYLYLNEDPADWFSSTPAPPALHINPAFLNLEPGADSIPREEALELGARYLQETFGAEIDLTNAEMQYIPTSAELGEPPTDETFWTGTAWQGLAQTGDGLFFEFRVDALTGAPLDLIWHWWFIDGDALEVDNSITHLLSPEELRHYIQVAENHAQALFSYRNMTVNDLATTPSPFDPIPPSSPVTSGKILVFVETLCGHRAVVMVMVDTGELVSIGSTHNPAL